MKMSSIEESNGRRKNKLSRFSLQYLFKCLEDPNHPSAGPYLSLMYFTGNWHPNKELKMTRFKQVVYYITMFFFFSQYIKCAFSLKLSALLYILQTAPFHLGTAKTIFFRKDYNEWHNLFDYISTTERQQLAGKDDAVVDIMDNYIKKSRKVIYWFWILAISCNFSIFSEPYQKNITVDNGTDVYVKIFDFFVPFNQEVPPGYYYSMALQTVVGNVMSSYVIACDSVIISTLIFFAGQLKISRVYCSKVINPLSSKQSRENIVMCHRFHTSLIGYQQKFNNLISSVMFIYLIVVSINLGACIIQISRSAQDLAALMASVLFVIGCLTQLLIYYWYSNEVTVESLSVSYGIFESEWYTMDAKVQKEIALLQFLTSKRMVFKAGLSNEMSLNTFVAILKTSYSFFTLLNGTKN